MRPHCWTIVIAALLLSACGAPQPAQQAGALAIAPDAASAPATAAPTSAPTARPTAIPTTAPTSAPATAAPTEPIILPPTVAPTAVFRAEPTAAPQPAQASAPAPKPKAAGGPARLVIGDIKLDYQLVSVGLDKDRVPIVPDHDVGWYNLSAGPGQGENIVLWGHVLRFRATPNIAAPFARLKELKTGASVVLYDADGNTHNYTITQQIWVTPEQVEYILPQGKEMITMVSCIGDKVIIDGEVVDETHRLITVAEPA